MNAPQNNKENTTVIESLMSFEKERLVLRSFLDSFINKARLKYSKHLDTLRLSLRERSILEQKAHDVFLRLSIEGDSTLRASGDILYTEAMSSRLNLDISHALKEDCFDFYGNLSKQFADEYSAYNKKQYFKNKELIEEQTGGVIRSINKKTAKVLGYEDIA